MCQHSARNSFLGQHLKKVLVVVFLLVTSALAKAQVSPIFYNAYNPTPVASAELACTGIVDFFNAQSPNNPPLDLALVRAEYYQDFDGKAISSHPIQSGTCVFVHTKPENGSALAYFQFSLTCNTGYLVIKKATQTASCI